MSNASDTRLTLRTAYRGVSLTPQARTLARASLTSARDALDLALLVLEEPTESRAEAQAQTRRARDFMAEAVTELSRARIHVPGIRTVALPALLASLPDPRFERARLQQLASRLLWWNHAHLPVKVHAQPMAPEDEAQLARLIRSLDGQRRFARALRHKWVAGAALAGAMTAVIGFPAAVAALACVTAGIAELTREQRLTPADA